MQRVMVDQSQWEDLAELALQLFELGKYKKGVKCVKYAIKDIRKNGDEDALLRFFKKLNRGIQKSKGATENLIRILQVLFKIIEDLPITEVLQQRIEILNNLACQFTKLGKLHTAKQWLCIGVKDVEQHYSLPCNRTQLYLNTCTVYSSLKNFPEALNYCKQAISIAQTNLIQKKFRQENPKKEVRILGMAFYNLGTIYESTRQKGMARQQYAKTVELLKSNNQTAYFLYEKALSAYHDTEKSLLTPKQSAISLINNSVPTPVHQSKRVINRSRPASAQIQKSQLVNISRESVKHFRAKSRGVDSIRGSARAIKSNRTQFLNSSMTYHRSESKNSGRSERSKRQKVRARRVGSFVQIQAMPKVVPIYPSVFIKKEEQFVQSTRTFKDKEVMIKPKRHIIIQDSIFKGSGDDSQVSDESVSFFVAIRDEQQVNGI